MRDLARLPAALRPAAEILIAAAQQTTTDLDALHHRRSGLALDPTDSRGIEQRIARCVTRLASIDAALDVMACPIAGLCLLDGRQRRRRERGSR